MPSIRKKLATKKTKLASPQKRIDDHPASLNGLQEGNLYNVELDLITPDPSQPRKYFDSEKLEELSQSIKEKGVLQPVIIRKNHDETLYLVAGERRFRAAKMAGLAKIPAILTRGNPMEISLIENLQRDNLKPIEEAEALSRMIDEYSYTHEQLASVIGKARSTITETLALNKLPDQIKDECRRADIYPRRLLVEIAKQGSPKAMISLFAQAKENNLKSGQLREITRRSKRNPRSPEEIALEKISDLLNHLKKLDHPKLSLLTDELKNLKLFIEEILSQ
jgi:ParB family chromosome partitioning protein